MKADLHLHTTASDGLLSPAELVRRSAESGVEVIAITDHDTVEGIAEVLDAASAFPKLTVIPGVEISTDIPGDEVHILGYYLDYRGPELIRILTGQRAFRGERGRKMVDKLVGLGVRITLERVLEIADGASLGRPHIAQAMVEGGYVSSLGEAFSRYIGRYGPAYVEREKLTPVEAVEMVVRMSGLPVLAHPADIVGLEDLLRGLIGAGLVGMEVYYIGYSAEKIDRLSKLAADRGLIACGGSDYHGFEGNNAEIGAMDIPRSSIVRLAELARERSLVLS
ncbi:PHP domain-containing protein [Chloroflexota bacterium]